eukprot:2344245-Lingulodinium_polyedra.AAC.1
MPACSIPLVGTAPLAGRGLCCGGVWPPAPSLKAPFPRSSAGPSTLECHDLDGEKWTSLVDLLLWLYKQGRQTMLVVGRSLLCWLAFVIESSSYFDSGSEDALLDAPV